MATVLDIKRRIRSVINTRQITKAMKMVSAAKLRRAQERALAARPYALMLTNVLKSLVSRADVYDPVTGEPRHPLLMRREERNVLLIVVTGDKGLAGAFNANLLRATARFLETKQDKNVEVIAIGRKGRDFLRRNFGPAAPAPSAEENAAPTGNVHLVGELVGALNKIEFHHASELAEQVIERYTNGEIDAVYLLYNEFKSVIAQRLIVDKILPIAEVGEQDIHMAMDVHEAPEHKQRAIDAARTAGVSHEHADTSEMDAKAKAFGTANVDYIYEQGADELFRALLPKYIGNQVFRAFMESVAAEHAARMTAMDAATSAATDMIDSLTLVMNRARQAKITKEIIEIVSGAAAL